MKAWMVRPLYLEAEDDEWHIAHAETRNAAKQAATGHIDLSYIELRATRLPEMDDVGVNPYNILTHLVGWWWPCNQCERHVYADYYEDGDGEEVYYGEDGNPEDMSSDIFGNVYCTPECLEIHEHIRDYSCRLSWVHVICPELPAAEGRYLTGKAVAMPGMGAPTWVEDQYADMWAVTYVNQYRYQMVRQPVEKATRTVHVEDGAPGAVDVWSHKSKWRNPYRAREFDANYQVAEQAITDYEKYVRGDPDLMAAIPELIGKPLECTCRHEDIRAYRRDRKSGKRCHADILVMLAHICHHHEVNGTEWVREGGEV